MGHFQQQAREAGDYRVDPTGAGTAESTTMHLAKTGRLGLSRATAIARLRWMIPKAHSERQAA
jgi:hypothetical protein